MKYKIPSKSELTNAQFVKIVGPDGLMIGYQYDERTNALFYRNEQIIIPEFHGNTHISSDPVPTATTDTQGHMSADDKAKLDTLIQTRVGILGFLGSGFPSDGGWITGDIIFAAGSEFISIERIGNIVRFNVGTQIPACVTEECANIFWVQDETEPNAIRPPSCSGKLPGINGYGELKIYAFPESTIYNTKSSTSVLAQKGQYPCLIFKRYDDALSPNSAEFEMVLERHENVSVNYGLMKTGMSFTPGVIKDNVQGKAELLYKMGIDNEGNQIWFEFDPELEPDVVGKMFYKSMSITTQWGVITGYPPTITTHNQYKMKKWSIQEKVQVGDEVTVTNIWQYNNIPNEAEPLLVPSLRLDITKSILPIGKVVKFWQYRIYEGGTEDIFRYFINDEPSIDAGSLWSLGDVIRFGDNIERLKLDTKYHPDPTDKTLESEILNDMSLYENSNWGLNGLNQPLYLFEQIDKQVGELSKRFDIDLDIVEGDIKHAYIYDTTLDLEDWRIEDELKNTSWYNEEQDSIDRGGGKMFPEKVVIICADHLYIFDAKDGALWMRFKSNVVSKSWDRFVASAAKNGQLYIIENDTTKPKQLSFTGVFHDNSNNWKVSSTISAPSARSDFASTVYNNKLFVWGGVDGMSYFNTGAIYDMINNSWTAMSTTNAPSARAGMVHIQVGNKLYIWGGLDGVDYLNDGAIYDMEEDSWEEISASPISGRSLAQIGHYSGKIIIWGGFDGVNYFNTGAIYNITTNTWSLMTNAGLIEGRVYFANAVLGNKFVIAGGEITGGLRTDTVHYYNIDSNEWGNLTSLPNELVLMAFVKIDESRMMIYGGIDSTPYDTSYIYNINTDTWEQTATSSITGAARFRAEMTYDGERYVVMFGGVDIGDYYNTGDIYDVLNDEWLGITFTYPTTGERRNHALHYWNNNVIIWGGQDAISSLNTGGIYYLSPSEIVEEDLKPRFFHAHCRTGQYLFIHGGYNDFDGYLDDCWLFDEQTYEWTEITNCPLEKRAAHTAVFDGLHGIYVWGGYNSENGFFEDGAIYDLTSGAWTTISTEGCPQARAHHTAVWCNGNMIIWGGISYLSGNLEVTYLNTGGMYDGTTWTPTTLTDVPNGRIYHTASVYDDKMYILGGISYVTPNREADLTIYSTFYEFNPAVANGEWSELTPYMGTTDGVPIHSHAATITGNYLYISGGVSSDGRPIEDHYRCDLTDTTIVWASRTDYDEEHTEHSMCAITNGHLKLGGINIGVNPYDITKFTELDFSNQLSFYTIGSDDWVNLNSLNLPQIARASMYRLDSGHIVIFGGYNKHGGGGVRWINFVEDTDKLFTSNGLYSFEDNKTSSRNTDSSEFILDDFVKLPTNVNYAIEATLVPTYDTIYGLINYRHQFIVSGWSGGTIINNHRNMIRLIIGGDEFDDNPVFWSSTFKDINCMSVLGQNLLGVSFSHDHIGNHEAMTAKSINTLDTINIEHNTGMRLCKTIYPHISSNTPLYYLNQYFDSDIKSVKVFEDSICPYNIAVSTNDGINILKYDKRNLGTGTINTIFAHQKYSKNYITDLIMGEVVYHWLIQYENDYDFTRNIIADWGNISTSPLGVAIDMNLEINNVSNVYQSSEYHSGYVVKFNGQGYLSKNLTDASRQIPCEILETGANENMMWSGWWKFDYVNSVQYLISQWDESGNQSYRIYLGLDNKIHAEFSSITNSVTLVSDGHMLPNEWYKIDVVWFKYSEATEDLSYVMLFINGVLQEYSTANFTLTYCNVLTIGAHYNMVTEPTYSDYFKGSATHLSVSSLHEGIRNEFVYYLEKTSVGIPIESTLIKMIKESYNKGRRAYISNPSGEDNNKLYGSINDFNLISIDKEQMYYASKEVVGKLSFQDDTKQDLLYDNTQVIDEGIGDLNNIIAYYRCNDGDKILRDVENNNDGTINNGEWSSLKDRVLLTLRSGAYVDLPALTLTNTISINLWSQILNESDGTGTILLLYQDSNNYISIGVETTGTDRVLTATLQYGGIPITNTYTILGDNYSQINQLNMITLVISSGTLPMMRLYINKELKDENVITGISSGEYSSCKVGMAGASSIDVILSNILIASDVLTEAQIENIYNKTRTLFYKSNYNDSTSYIETQDDLIVFQGGSTKKLILSSNPDGITKVPNVSDIDVFYRGEIDTTIPGMKVTDVNVTGQPKHPIFIWHRQNHDDIYVKTLIGRPDVSEFPPIDILLRAPIDSHDTRYFDITERGIITQGVLTGKFYVICKNIQYDDLGESGYIVILDGSYQGYIWRYDHKLYGFNDTLILAGSKQFPFDGDIVEATNPETRNGKSKPDKPIVVASMVDNYTSPVVRLEFSIVDQPTNQTTQLQFKVGVLDVTQPYELDDIDTSIDNLVRGMGPSQYAISKVYSQTGFVKDPAKKGEVIVSDPNFIVWDGGKYDLSGNEQWNSIEILYRFPEVWIWWNNLLITPVGNPTTLDPNAQPVNTTYFPMNIDFPIGKTGLKLWPGAIIRSFEIKDKLSQINEYARM